MIFQKLLKFFFKDDDYDARSYSWTTVRKKHLENHPYCAACGRNKKLEVHHIKPFYLNPELELDPSNLITLCDDPCHFVFGHLMNYKSWNTNVVKDCETYYDKIKNRPQ
jgi:5-methylcytosine-specific restriction endonuclease McrA